MADLVDKILGASLKEAPEPVLAVMRLSLADWLAVGLAGQGEAVARLTRDMVLAEAGRAEATLFGGAQAPVRAAALANGAAGHALDYDDTHFAHIGHPSVAVIPAALAMAERTGAGKDAFLRAALAGCEASVRFGLALGRGHYQAGFHQTATAGAFGATVAAVQLLSQDRAVMRQALGLVSTRASGLKSQFGTMGKPYNAGIAAANGVEAALLAERGFVSNPDAVDGPLGFFSTHHADGDATGGDAWLMASVSHKFHACCHGLHAALEALESLKPVDVDRLQAIEVITHPRWMTVCNQPAPQTGLEAKFSYRTVLALSLTGHDTAALESFNDTACLIPGVMALRDIVKVHADPAMPETAAEVRLQGNGEEHVARHDLSAPMSLDGRTGKLKAKTAALLGGEESDDLWQAVQNARDDLTGITALMTRKRPPKGPVCLP